MPKAVVKPAVANAKKEVKVKTVKAKVAPKSVAAASTVTTAKKSALHVAVYSLAGKETDTLELPKAVFGQPVNNQILSQAVRVYMTNRSGHHAHTKTRGEVAGSTRKMGSQKGSGHARHGSIMAPIYVGGGIALGPRARVVRLELPKKMKKSALIAALCSKMTDGEIIAVDGLDKATGKTKQMAAFFKAVNKTNVLVVTDEKKDDVVRSVRNLSGFDVTYANQLNAFDIISHKTILLTKEAVTKLSVAQSKLSQEREIK